MASNKRLKAFVRFDGTGRVIPGSLNLQAKKPKVGNWKEIPAYECCNPTTTTTTTVSSTQFTRSYWLNETDACNTTTFGSITFYTTSNVVTGGINIFSDPGLTTPITEGYVISEGMSRYLVGANGLLSAFTCS